MRWSERILFGGLALFVSLLILLTLEPMLYPYCYWLGFADFVVMYVALGYRLYPQIFRRIS